MLATQGFQYVLRMKPRKQALLRRWTGCRRFVFNEALAHQKAEIAEGRRRPGYAALCARLPALKQQHPWLCEPPAQALQQAVKDLCVAWERTYTSHFGAPRFKKKGEGDTLRLPQGCRYDASVGVLHLPKLGAVRLRHSRQALGQLKNVTLRQDRGRWLASLQTERELEVGVSAATLAVGLDFGVTTTIMPSAGEPIVLPSKIGRYERRMKRLQISLSRKQKGSRNRAKARERVAACHAKIGAMRRDFLHQRTTELVKNHAFIAIEDLAVKNMSASAAGTLDKPGKNVKAKSGLNRSIQRNGWSMARRMLEYKCAWSGSIVVAVPPAYTSQRCSACGHVASESRTDQATFRCTVCGYAEHADRNAAKNILAAAQLMLAKTEEALPGGCSARTAGYAGTHACEGERRQPQRPRPRSAARGMSVGIPLAGTDSELSHSGNLHPSRYELGWKRISKQEVIAPALAAIRGGMCRSSSTLSERNVLLSASDGVMRIATKNAVFHVQTQIPMSGEAFAVVVSGDLAEIVTRLAGPIAFMPKDKSLTLKANGTTLRLSCMDPKAFVEPKQEEARVKLTLPAAALCRALSVVEGVILTEDSRVFLNGALLEVTETQLTVVGSDGYTLAIARVEASASASAKAILPTRAVREAIKVLRGAGDAAAHLHVGDTKVELHCGALRLLAQLVDSTFPDWKKVVSSLAADAVSVEVPRAAFAAALERLSVVVRSDSRVQLRGEPGKVTLCSSGAEQGAEDEVQATCAAACEITLRRDQVRLAADVMSGEKLLIKFKSGEATQPALIAGAVRSECFIVSPMKP